MTNWKSGQFVLDTKDNRINYGPFVIFTNDESASLEKNLLDFYLKIKLNNFDVNRNPISWQAAKEKLGRHLFKNEERLKELVFYKRWMGTSVLLNILLASIIYFIKRKK